MKFSLNGINFELARTGKWWQLYYYRECGHRVALSIWRTRKEAKEAAARFAPKST